MSLHFPPSDTKPDECALIDPPKKPKKIARGVTRKRKRKSGGGLRSKTTPPATRYCPRGCWHAEPCVFIHARVVADVSFFPQSAEEGEGEGDEEDGEGDDKGTPKGRKKIRKILKDDKLRSETQNALKEEEERRKRIAEKERLREKLREVSRLERQ